jgi:hypothetical protein
MLEGVMLAFECAQMAFDVFGRATVRLFRWCAV